MPASIAASRMTFMSHALYLRCPFHLERDICSIRYPSVIQGDAFERLFVDRDALHAPPTIARRLQ